MSFANISPVIVANTPHAFSVDLWLCSSAPRFAFRHSLVCLWARRQPGAKCQRTAEGSNVEVNIRWNG